MTEICEADRAEMVYIPADEFLMGSNDGGAAEKPIHTVNLDAFYIDVYPVTNAQYNRFISATKHPESKYWDDSDFNQSNQPAVRVTWYDAMAYCQWAGKQLPTEAEWEKAARGKLESKRFPWSDENPADKWANFGENVRQTTPVGRYPPNGYGLYDTAGNVWEWCLDEYQSDFYQNSSTENPVPDDNRSDLLINYKSIKTPRVLRGSSWHLISFYMRVATRYWNNPVNWINSNGFRCCTSSVFP